MSNSKKLKVASYHATSRVEFELFDDKSLGLTINGLYSSVTPQGKIELAKFLLPILEGNGEHLTYDDAIHVLSNQNYMASVKVLRDARKKNIEWRPGDVVVVTYPSSNQSYTYVRGSVDWPGDDRRKTDEHVNDWYGRGWVKLVCQKGGEPFDQNRIPAGAK